MSRTTEYLMNIRRIIKIQEALLKEVCQEFNLTLTEATVITFLHNNPGKDTAADIVELRMLQKGNVSQAVDSLVKKDLLEREQDQNDRRKIHLHLTKGADPMIASMGGLWEKFSQELFKGISREEMQSFDRVNEQMKYNMQRITGGKKNDRE